MLRETAPLNTITQLFHENYCPSQPAGWGDLLQRVIVMYSTASLPVLHVHPVDAAPLEPPFWIPVNVGMNVKLTVTPVVSCASPGSRWIRIHFCVGVWKRRQGEG